MLNIFKHLNGIQNQKSYGDCIPKYREDICCNRQNHMLKKIDNKIFQYGHTLRHHQGHTLLNATNVHNND